MSPAGASPLAAYGALSFAYFAAIGLFNPYSPLWFQQLGLSTVAIGALASLQAWTRVVAPYAWGWASDHHGRRHRLIRIAAVAAVLTSFALISSPGMAALVAIVAVMFLANGGIVPLAEAALVRRLSRDGALDAGRYGRVRVWGSIGFIVSVSAFGVLLERVGIGAFPWFVAAMGLGLIAAAWRVPAADDEEPHAADAAPPAAWPVLRQPAVAWFFASAFFTVLAHSVLYAFFSLYLVELGYGKAAIGALWAVAVAVEIAFFWTQGHWFTRWSPAQWLQAAALVCALRFAAMAGLGGAAWVLVLAQATHAVTFAAHHAACIATVQRWFPGALRARGQALYTMLAYGLSGVLAGLGGGLLASHLGFAAVFWAAAAASVLAWVCVQRAMHHDEARARLQG